MSSEKSRWEWQKSNPHEVQMWATANSGAGATFHFTIPGGAEAHT